jgi:hypothetical protein
MKGDWEKGEENISKNIIASLLFPFSLASSASYRPEMK